MVWTVPRGVAIGGFPLGDSTVRSLEETTWAPSVDRIMLVNEPETRSLFNRNPQFSALADACDMGICMAI